MIEVIREECVGCALCVKACAYDAITMVEKTAEIDVDKCNRCDNGNHFDNVHLEGFGGFAADG